MVEITDFEYPDIKRTDFIDDSLPKILARDDAAKHSYRRQNTFPNVTADDIGMKVWWAGKGTYQLMSVDPEPQWKQITDDNRTPAYMDTLIDEYQPLSAVLTSLARLNQASNALPYFYGPSDMQATPLTTYAMRILSQSNSEGVISVLGLGDLALVNAPLDGSKIKAGSISKDKIDDNFARNLGWTTGDVKLTYKTTADDGWVMMNDGSIGNASSGATARANADCYELFKLMYNISACTLQTASGAASNKTNVASDWASNKRLLLPKVLGRALAGAGAGSGLTSRTIGSSVGKNVTTTTSSDHVRLSNGVLIQWGNNINTSNGIITYPVPFANTNYGITVSSADTGNWYDGWVRIEARSTSTATVYLRNYENSHYHWKYPPQVSWIAIGN